MKAITKNWKTSILGALMGVAQLAPLLSRVGVHVGHYGATDFVTLGGALATVALGLYAKDGNVTGGSIQQ